MTRPDFIGPLNKDKSGALTGDPTEEQLATRQAAELRHQIRCCARWVVDTAIRGALVRHHQRLAAAAAVAAAAALASAASTVALDKDDVQVQDDADERWESYGICGDSDSDAQTSFD